MHYIGFDAVGTPVIGRYQYRIVAGRKYERAVENCIV